MKVRFGAYLVALSMVLVVATIALDTPMARLDAADAAVGDLCSTPYSGDVSLGSAVRCIAGKEFRTRGWLRPECFENPKVYAVGAAYWRSECKGSKTSQVEAIAQTRATMRLSQSPLGEVQPNFQFEFGIAGKRADLLQYDRFQPSSPLDLAEVKVIQYDGSAEIADAAEQLQRYVLALQSALPGNTVRQRNSQGYFDSFLVLNEPSNEPCSSPDDTATYERYDVTSSPTQAGLLLAREVAEIVRECDSQSRPVPDPENEPSYEEPYAQPLPDPIDRPPVVVPGPGSDDDNDGQDDFLEDLREHIPEFFEDNPLPLIPGLPSGADINVSWEQLVLVAAVVAVVIGVALCGPCIAALSAFFATPGLFASTAGLAAAVATLFMTLFGFSVWGDPHLATLDGLAYDLQAVGEFHLLEIPSLDIDVQGRFVGQGTKVSLLSATAFELNGTWVQIEGNTLKLDGVAVPPERLLVDLGDGATVIRSAEGWVVTWPGQGDRVAMVQRGRSVAFHVPDGLTDVRGLLGNANGNPDDDLKYRNGSALAVPASASTLHGSFANSWRINDEESLFTYGAGQSTDDFTNLTFPSQIATLADFTAQEVEAAQTVCVDEGVLPGPQFEDCVFDVASTADESYASSAALVTEPLVDGTAHEFDSSGALDEDFEGAVGSNFVSTRYLNDAATSKIAGPVFDGSGYRFYVRDVNRHAAVDASTDVYVFGPVTTDSVDQNLDVKAGDAVVGSIDFDNPTPAFAGSIGGTLAFDAAGTTATGTAFKRYRLELAIPHTHSGFDLSFVPSGFKGLFSTSLGFDNIELQLDTPAAQVFSADLPADVPSASLPVSSGAGVIEQVAGQDEFVFDLANAGRIVLAHDSCLSGATYRLVRVGTNDVVTTSMDCKDQVVGPLVSGEYRLEVTAPVVGIYSLGLYELPDPEEFAYTLDSVVSNGAPELGAGNIERFGEVDRHTFSVPAGGKTLQFERLGSQRNMAIKNATSGSQVASFVDDTRVTLPEGDYFVETGWPTGGPGTYSFRLYEAPATQTFAYSIGAVVSNGTPAAGAGNVERTGSVDRYSFSVPAGGKVLQFNPLGSLRRMVLKDSQSEVPVADLVHGKQVTLPQGDFYLETGWPSGGAGTYSFELYEAPAPQLFSYSVGSVVSNGVPATGAGSIEQNGSLDRYSFSVPAGGKVLQFNRLGAQRNMVLKNATTGEQLAKFVDNRQLSLAQGAYYLETGWPTGGPGTYSFELYEVPGPQVFSYSLDTVVANGVPAAGAGNIELNGSVDRYTFSVPVGGKKVQFNRLGSQRNIAIKNAATGAQVATFVDNTQLTLPEGSYYLETGWPTGGPGTYSFNLYEVPAQQVFSYTLDTVVSNGTPAAGAGNIERIGSSDRYTFSIPAGGKTLQFNRLGSQRNMVLKNAATGAQVTTFVDNAQVTLPEGDYYLDTGWPTGGTGTYSFNLYEVPAQQVFSYTLDTVVSNGTPAAGAGNIERIGSSDRYTFSIPAGGKTLQFNRLGSQRNMVLKNAATGAQVTTFVDNAQVTLPEGDYYLDTGWPTGGTGTYSFNLYEVPAQQVFAYTLGSVVSNGVPSAGAGNVERVGSVDRYTFTIPAGGQTVQFTRLGAQRNMNLKNAATGAQVVQMVNSTQITLPAGSYYLDTGWPTGGTGTYSFKLT